MKLNKEDAQMLQYAVTHWNIGDRLFILVMEDTHYRVRVIKTNCTDIAYWLNSETYDTREKATWDILSLLHALEENEKP